MTGSETNTDWVGRAFKRKEDIHKMVDPTPDRLGDLVRTGGTGNPCVPRSRSDTLPPVGGYCLLQ